MSKLPPFTPDGVLPPGDYLLTLDELRTSMLVLGPGEPRQCPTWDASWRETLVGNLAVLVRQLWQVGITEIFVDGSFAEDKDHPNDIDGYFVCGLHELASGDLQRQAKHSGSSQDLDLGPGDTTAASGLPEKAVANVASVSRRVIPALRAIERYPGSVRQ